MPSFDHNEANRLTEAANAAQLKPTNEAPLRRAIRFQQASQSTDLQSGHSNMDNGKALPVPPPTPPPPLPRYPGCLSAQWAISCRVSQRDVAGQTAAGKRAQIAF